MYVYNKGVFKRLTSQEAAADGVKSGGEREKKGAGFREVKSH